MGGGGVVRRSGVEQVFWCVLVFGAEQVPWLHGEKGGRGGDKSSGVRWLSGTTHIDSGRFHTGDILSGYFVLAC